MEIPQSPPPTAPAPGPGKPTPVFAFGPRNYRLMFVGLGVLALGFFLMTTSKEPYGFGFVSLTLGPLVLILGFAIQFVAILVRNKPNA